MGIKNESLELAISLEEKGHAYYEKHAENAVNPLVKKVLKSLGAQELDHVEKIKQIAEGKEIEEDYEPSDIESEVKEVFEEFSDKEREGWKEENVDVYEHAMELEKDIYQVYERLAEETDDPKEKEFFEALMEEEDKHYESLQNVYYYFTRPGDWFAQEESKVWNWMNM
ncbi:ferritin-like domain-containing protein [Sporohalobacter salinus]|uniref:ferritin-like domain-containing protein n=1 Tax=Sporohalobacter salinus TaxID=1494606 RepID=UPI001961FA40|nr:ferritin family protein [Sporohalobacter salinus]MBM7623623.1 rubrerythrin [Sporohalobacter salinus]